MIVALVLSSVTPAHAVTINSQTEPVVTTNDNGADALHEALSNPKNKDAPLKSPDPSFDSLSSNETGTTGLTSNQLALDQSITLNGPPVNLLRLNRYRYASSASIAHVDPDHPVAIEDLATSEEFDPPIQLVLWTAAATALLVLASALLHRHLQQPRGKRIRFGILWDAYKPICGRCQSLLHVLNDYSFQCPSCNVELGARGDNGKTISPREALVKIRLKEYW